MFKSDIDAVIKDQRNWVSNDDNSVIREDISSLKPTSSFAIVICGIRRCGKSTLLRQISQKEKIQYYLNLEDVRLEDFVLKDFLSAEEVFDENYGKDGVYFFDEVQTVDKWEKYVRSLVDKKKKVVVSGSNASLLSKELGTLLTGRHLTYELFPFSFTEYLNYVKQKPNADSFNQYLRKGGFAEYLERADEIVLQELLKDIVIRDVAIRHSIKNSDLLIRLALYLITNVGKPFSFNSLKETFSVASVQTVIDYMSFFEDAYLIFTVPRFSYSYKKQQVNPKKIYSIDNGLSLANSVSFSKDEGRMLENCVFLHLRRKHKEIFYFKEKGECDFVISEKGKIVQAVQVCVKLDDHNLKRETDGLVEALKELKLDSGLIITLDQEDKLEIDEKKLDVIPAWKWMSKSLRIKRS